MDSIKFPFEYFWACLTKQYYQFAGRARRREYWSFALIQWAIRLLGLIFYLLFVYLTSSDSWPEEPSGWGEVFGELSGGMLLVDLLISLPLCLPWLGVLVRRLHDAGCSGYWAGSTPLFFFAILGYSYGLTSGSSLISLICGILSFLTLVASIYTFVCTLKDSYPDENKYGENPKD